MSTNFEKKLFYADLYFAVGGEVQVVCSEGLQQRREKRLALLFGDEIAGRIKRVLPTLWEEVLCAKGVTETDATEDAIQDYRRELALMVHALVRNGKFADEQE